MHKLKHILKLNSLLILFAVLFSNSAKSQVYPVQTNISTAGPYYNYLSYYADENNHLQAIVTLTDFNSGPIQARLRITIEGPGYDAVTNPNIVVGNAFTLEPGVPNFINGIDLAPYLLSSNLLVTPSGIDLNNLPSGFTTICVDVIRNGTNQEVLSTNNCTSFFLQRFQPPQGVFPVCASNLNAEDMFYTFQWSPPLGYVPAIGTELDYTFSLYEWNDPNNYTIFQTGQGLVYTTQTSTAVVQLSEYDVLLQEGTQYVWRVEAHLTSNGLPIDMIENNGVSEPCSFMFGASQTLEETLADGLSIDLNATGEGENKGNAYWTVIDNTPGEGLSTYSSFLVSYRKKPTGNESFELTWLEDTVTGYNNMMYQLEDSTVYEVFVQGIVGNFISEPSETVEFTTLEARVYACGESDLPYLLPNYNPLANALVGMRFQIGQFTMQVTEITPNGALGHYSGKGLIPIAFLAGAKAKVRFDDILVDDQYVIREGQVDVVTKGLDNWLFEQYMQFIDPIYVDGTIDSAYVEDGVAWVVVDGESLQFEFDPPEYPVIVNDENGGQYTIWPDGTIEIGTYLVVSDDYLDVGVNDVATFVQNDNENFGFDGKEHMQWHENYEVIQLNDTASGDSSYYFVANKSIGEGETDVVDVVIPASASSVTVKLDGSTTLSGALTGNTVTIPNNLSKGKHAIYIFSGSSRIGKLNVQVYSKKEKQVVFVPLTAGILSQAEIDTALTQTFGEANIDVAVTVADQWNDSVFTTTQLIGLPENVNIFSHYSSDMKDLRDRYFEANDTATKNAYYIFVVPGFDNAGVTGYMVRGRALGFVKAGSDALVYAHELGHGIGALKHTWQDGGPEEGKTNNLMDYDDGIESGTSISNYELTKFQWKEMRDLDVVPGMFDEVEDAESATIFNIETLSSLYNDDSTSITFLSMGGKPITIEGNLNYLEFSTEEDKWQKGDERVPVGTLIGFEVDNVYYRAVSGVYQSSNARAFLGYCVPGNTSSCYVDTLSYQSQYKYVNAGIVCLQNGTPHYKVIPLDTSDLPRVTLVENEGRGPIGEEDQYVDLFYNVTNGVNVVATFDENYTSELQLIQSITGSDLCGKEAVYALRAAQLIKTNPNLSESCVQEIMHWSDIKSSNDYGLYQIDENDPNWNVSSSSSYALHVLPSKKVYLFYEEIKDFIELIEGKDITGILNSVEGTDNTISIEFIINYYNIPLTEDISSNSNRKCVIESIPFDVRKKLLLTLNQTHHSFFTDKEYLIADLIKYVPSHDQFDLANFLSRNKGENFWSLYSDVYNNGAREQFMTAIAELVFNSSTYSEELNVWPGPSLGGGAQQTKFLHVAKDIKLDENGNLVQFGAVRTLGIENTLTDDGDIKLSYYEYITGATHKTYGTYFEGDIFEYVAVEFTQDFQFASISGEKITKGSRMVVPAVWLYWILEKQNSIETWKNIRVAINIGAALITAGTTSGLVMAAELTWNAIDITVAFNEDDILSSGNSEQIAYLDIYNRITAIAGISVGGTTLFMNAESIVSGVAKFTRSRVENVMKNVRSIPQKYDEFVTNFKGLYQELKAMPDGYYSWKPDLKAFALNTYLELNIARYAGTMNHATVLVEDGTKLIVKLSGTNNKIQIGDIVTSSTMDIDHITNLRWFDDFYNQAAHGDVLTTKALEFDNLAYMDDAGVIHNSKKLEIIETSGGQVFVRLAGEINDFLPEVFEGARQYVRNNYTNGQEILNNLTQKFGNSQGAAAEIIKKFGNDGLEILNKVNVNSIDDAAKELIQGKTLYRYVNETSYNFNKLLTKGQIDAAPSQFPGYTTLDKFTDASEAKSILQLPNQPTWVAEFDAAQIIDDVSFPMGNFNNATYKEVVTRSYPNYGTGGGSQLITTSEINISRLKNLSSGEVIDFIVIRSTYNSLNENTLFKSHIFEGKIKKTINLGSTQPSFNVSGVHHTNAVDNVSVRISDKSSIDANGVYSAKVEMYHEDLLIINGTGWKKKGSNSTFFPDSWEEERILYEISYAFENKQLVLGSTNKYTGTSASGLEIEMFINNGVIETAYPIKL